MPAWRNAQFLQDNHDRRRIFTLVTQPGRPPVGYGPLTLGEIWRGWYTEPQAVTLRAGDPDLGTRLGARRDETHDLEDYFEFYGYPSEVIGWVDSTPPDGYDIHEVVQRLGLDFSALFRDSYTEALMPDNATDAAGDPLFISGFVGNWAVSDLTGQADINPRAYRFKAWLSFHG